METWKKLRRNKRALAVGTLVALSLLLESAADAQELREIASGDRVRVTPASRIAPNPVIGSVLTVAPDTLVIERDGGGIRGFAAREVRRIEISVGRRTPSAGKAAAGGLLVASPFLTLLGIGIIRADGPEISAPLTVAFVGVAAVGAFAGLLVFGTHAQDEWVEATWPPAPIEGARP